MHIAGVILAGGQGLRMGGADKALLHLNGVPLIDLAIQRFHPQVERLAISANGDAARFATGFPVLPDRAETTGLGPLAGLLAAMDWAADAGCDHLATCAVDTPHFPCDLVARLRLALDGQAGAKVALAQGARVHGTFGLWPVTLRGDLAAFLASGAKPKLLDYAQRHGAAFAQFPGESAFDNINTPADLARAQAWDAA